MNRTISTCSLMLLIFASVQLAHAQRLYDAKRDAEAQRAAALAAEITSKSSFEKQLRNLDTTIEHDLEVFFAGARRQMELNIRTFRTWGAVRKFAEQVQSTLDSKDFIPDSDAQAIADDLTKECPDRTTELGRSICEARDKLKDLQKAVADSERRGKELDDELKSRLENIDAIESLAAGVESLFDLKIKTNNTNVSITELSDVFLSLSRSTVNFINKLAVINNEPQDELRLLLQRIAVETLQLEVDHWKAVGAIKIRRASEQKNIQILVNDVKGRLDQLARCFSVTRAALDGARITDSIVTARGMKTCTIAKTDETNVDKEIPKERILSYMFQTLHGATALAARGETPKNLAERRLAQEERRFSIRHSAIAARSYEVALTSGTKRLSRFYAGGLKPAMIAQLINAAATVAIPGVIAGN